MYARILVPVDASHAAAAAMTEAARLARLCDARLRLLHVAEAGLPSAEAILYQTVPADLGSTALQAGAALLERLRDDAIREGSAVDSVLIESDGRKVHEIVNEQAQAWGAELLVLGTHGRRGVDRFLAGSVAEQVVRHADVPVLLVRRPQEVVQDGGLQSIAAAIA